MVKKHSVLSHLKRIEKHNRQAYRHLQAVQRGIEAVYGVGSCEQIDVAEVIGKVADIGEDLLDSIDMEHARKRGNVKWISIDELTEHD